MNFITHIFISIRQLRNALIRRDPDYKSPFFSGYKSILERLLEIEDSL